MLLGGTKTRGMHDAHVKEITELLDNNPKLGCSNCGSREPHHVAAVARTRKCVL